MKCATNILSQEKRIFPGISEIKCREYICTNYHKRMGVPPAQELDKESLFRETVKEDKENKELKMNSCLTIEANSKCFT